MVGIFGHQDMGDGRLSQQAALDQPGRRRRVKRLQSNGIVERLRRTLLDEHFRVEGYRTWFETVEEMRTSLDEYLVVYNIR